MIWHQGQSEYYPTPPPTLQINSGEASIDSAVTGVWYVLGQMFWSSTVPYFSIKYIWKILDHQNWPLKPSLSIASSEIYW